MRGSLCRGCGARDGLVLQDVGAASGTDGVAQLHRALCLPDR